MSPVAVDTFEPFWANAASVAGVLVGLVAIVLIIGSVFFRQNAASPRVYAVLAALLIAATCSSAAYHFFVRLPHIAEYERTNTSSRLVRIASNRLFEWQLGYAGVAGVLLTAAASLRVSRPVSPN